MSCSNVLVGCITLLPISNLCFILIIFPFSFKTSIAYAHSLGTRVRISLLRSVSKRQKEHDENAICSVTSFTARPMLRWLFTKYHL